MYTCVIFYLENVILIAILHVTLSKQHNSKLTFELHNIFTTFILCLPYSKNSKKIASDAGNFPTSEAIYPSKSSKKPLKATSPKTFQSAVRHCCDLPLQTAPILWETAYNRKIEEIFHPIGL